MSSDATREALAFAMFGQTRTCHLEIADDVIDKLEAQGLAIYKKKVFKHARRPTSSVRMTKELRMAIREAYRANPTLTQHEIAEMFNVNHGRVSEALE